MEWMVTREVVQDLLAAAELAHPAEACGLLTGRPGEIRGAVPATNVAADPLRHFEIDPAALVAAHKAARRGGPAVVGYYHSHPTGIAAPSATDRAMAAHDGSIWAIATLRDVTFWQDDEAGFVQLSCSIDDS